MKKILSLILFGALAVACTKDDPASLDAPETAAITVDITTDFEAVNPITETPSRAFDNASNGMYLGVIVSQDVSVHGQIWINVANNGEYSATVVTDKKEQMAFFGTPSSRSQEIISFVGKDGSFTYDVSDFNNPVASEISINGQEGFIQTVKDRSDQRAAAVLGTYVDLNDPTFTGSWDLITDGTPNDGAFGLPNLTQVCLVGPFGGMLVDAGPFETFEYPCFTLSGISPVFHTAGGAFGDINEFWAQDQVTDWGGVSATPTTYFLGQSTTVHIGNPQFDNPGFHNNDFAATPTPGCNVFTGGLQGIWFWNGRVGSATFMDPFAPPPPPPTLKNNTIDIDGFNEMISNIGSLEEADASVFK